jgi:hypothetical protein
MLVIALGVIAVVLLGMCLQVLQCLLAVMQKNQRAAEAYSAFPQVDRAAATPVPVAVSPSPRGDVLLENVDDQTAAMIMAVVAKETGAPVERLRFVSIKGI